ncbi:MAG: hypothetical protein ACP5VP_01695 [Candidatus Limnocylindrales bacterium]
MPTYIFTGDMRHAAKVSVEATDEEEAIRLLESDCWELISENNSDSLSAFEWDGSDPDREA